MHIGRFPPLIYECQLCSTVFDCRRELNLMLGREVKKKTKKEKFASSTKSKTAKPRPQSQRSTGNLVFEFGAPNL